MFGCLSSNIPKLFALTGGSISFPSILLGYNDICGDMFYRHLIEAYCFSSMLHVIDTNSHTTYSDNTAIASV